MSTVLFRSQGDQFFDASGKVLAGGYLNYYRAGTTTPQATYSEQTGVVANANPVPINSAGRITSSVFLGPNFDYKEVLTDVNGVTIDPWPIDNIPKAPTSSSTQTGFERLYLPWSQLTAASSPVTLLIANAGAAYECDATSGNIAIALPAAALIQSGTGYFFKRVDSSGNTVAVTPNGSETIDGSNSPLAVPSGYYGSYVVSDGAQWLTFVSYSPLPVIPSGTVVLFQQTAAPTGWTKITTNNDAMLRMVSGTVGTGGSAGLSAAWTSVAISGLTDGHALSSTEMPSHTHGITDPTHSHADLFSYPTVYGSSGGVGYHLPGSGGNTGASATGITINATGGGGAHTHTLGAASLTVTPKYVDVIAASRN